MEYRRRKGGDTWHFCTNCNSWPRDDFDEQSAKPTTGELCNECKVKQAAGDCH